MQGFRKCPKPLQQLVSIEEDHHGKASLAANNTIPPLHRSRAPIPALSVSHIPKGLKPTCHKYASSNQTSLQDRHQLRFRDLLAPSYVHLSKRPPSTSTDHHPNRKRYSCLTTDKMDTKWRTFCCSRCVFWGNFHSVSLKNLPLTAFDLSVSCLFFIIHYASSTRSSSSTISQGEHHLEEWIAACEF